MTEESSVDFRRPAPLREGEVVLLRQREGLSYLVPLAAKPTAIEGIGVVDLGPVIGRDPGTMLPWAGASFRVLRPSLADLLGHLRRRAQIVTPKDAMYLLYLAGVGPGARVAEAGSGSGALTIVLAHAVGPDGRVVSFDRRADFLANARHNVAAAGFADRVEFLERDVQASGLDGGPFDAAILDLPEPWSVVPSARANVRAGGRVATYTPTYNQLERTVRAFRSERFEEIRSVELLERALHVGEGGTRPDFDMLGHTGFLTGARRME
ncbi:MAG: tRNA (adenine-N1)-methyltransferase [Thermoplasmata archaeon]|nr:tRNA (adenine-N1)-methyltransferase [Thermoplasmata archaeon]